MQIDTIVMDVPPLLPVIDGRILADLADQIVFVTSWRRTPDQLAKRAIRGLGINQQKIAGVIVNEVDTDILEDSQSYVSPAASARGSTLRRAA